MSRATFAGETTSAPRAHHTGKNVGRGKTLTRLAALGTLSRSAGEELRRIHHKAPLPHRGRGGTEPAGLGG
jgi:hypothetical protein